jgi:hypothetical protein
MTSPRNKIKILIVVLTLLSLSWTSFNHFYFSHIHIDKTGKVIVHAHPYHKEGNQTKNAPTHAHSKYEFALLTLEYNILSFLSVFIIALFFQLKSKNRFRFFISLQENPTDYFFKNILRRGPPSLFQLI